MSEENQVPDELEKKMSDKKHEYYFQLIRKRTQRLQQEKIHPILKYRGNTGASRNKCPWGVCHSKDKLCASCKSFKLYR